MVKAHEASQLLQEGKTSKLCDVWGVHDGRCDLRGFRFPSVPPGGRPFNLDGLKIAPRRAAIEVRNADLDRVDFSHADFSDTAWSRCRLNGCHAERARLTKIRFYGSDLIDCNFQACDFGDALLGGKSRESSGTLRLTVFSGGRFSRVTFGSPSIEGCSFDCDVVNVDFNGSRLKDVKFSGKLDKVVFRRSATDSKLGKLNLSRLHENRMNGVDFSRADLFDVDFVGGLDLTLCEFPHKSRLFVILDGVSVFRKVKQEIESSWSGDDRRIGLGYTLNYFEDRIRGGQVHFLIDEGQFAESWDERLGHSYATLIREAARDLGAIREWD